jgi:hypothetical protein
VSLPLKLQESLVSREELKAELKKNASQGNENKKIGALTTVVTLGFGYWNQLARWAEEYSPIYGKDADLVRLASCQGWIPTDKQAAVLIALSERLKREGFREV